MTVFNRRNALLGFITLKFIERKLRRRKSKAPKIALFSIVGLASIVGIVAVLLRRRGDGDLGLGEEAESEIVGEYATTSSEPIPAT